MAATIDQIVARVSRQWVGYSFSWLSAMAARAGQADRALEYARLFERAFIGPNGFHLNGDQTRSGLSAFTYRPFMTQNVVFRASWARLLPGAGWDDLFPDEDADYILLNLVLAY